ncbi:MAG: tRNA(Ile2) 2-agmatinylcytidine synthetase [Methanocalculaceae archaeon]|jgi:methanogenesis imperfect marker protein 11|nr:tRNA(Ile2) 2-agmatinylcytidine synthetase [Methanocalculaceae archaeon]
MITLTPEQVKERFGPLFCHRLLVMTDEKEGIAELHEQCHARGPIEWDHMNRRRAGGALISAKTEGTTMTMTAKIGSYPIRFGPSDTELGGQALEAVIVNGNEVATTWAGAAGAGIGVAACLAQAPGVIRVEYNSEEDLHVGGAHICRSTIILPKYEKITFGIDDTDTKESGATWVLAMKCGEACTIDGAIFLGMRIIQLNPKAPEKTTNCTGSVITFAVKPEKKEELIQFVRTFVEERSTSTDTGICYWSGIRLPESSYAKRIKTELLTKDDATAEAEHLDIPFVDSANGKGRIGALGALLWANGGVEVAGLYGESP